MQLLVGLVILALTSLVAQILELRLLHWLLNNIWTIWLIAFIIIFQPELRRALAQLGQNRVLSFFFGHQEESDYIKGIVKATSLMKDKKIGALMVLEREIGLKNYVATGIKVESKVTSELLTSIFTPYTPLHDGAVIIQNGGISAAGCVLPLSSREAIQRRMGWGLRHQAGLGVSEETDAVAVVVSEETGSITLMMRGNIRHDINEQQLEKLLLEMFAETVRGSSGWSWK